LSSRNTFKSRAPAPAGVLFSVPCGRTWDAGLHPNDEDCIDSGDNDAVPEDVTTDLKGSDRIIDGTVDMGAYEYDADCED